MSFWKRHSSTDPKPEPLLRCSFCNKSQRDVRKMIAGPPTVQICDECVSVCYDIVAKEVRFDLKSPTPGSEGEVPCSICRNQLQAVHGLSLGMWGFLCQRCTEEVAGALKRGAPWDDGGSKAG